MRTIHCIVSILVLLIIGITIPSFAHPLQDSPQDASSVILLRDTLYVLDSTFVEVDLSRQRLYYHHRDGRIYDYPVSTGDASLDRGVATRTGIFTIKEKQRRHVSSIFDVPMQYWMPFDGGIGFHALNGKDYYRFLGVRPSSHGCVRMSREDAGALYESAGRGTAVIVHKGNPARVLQFGDRSIPYLHVMETIDHSLLKRRLALVQKGAWGDSLLRRPVALPQRKVFWGRIPVGETKVLIRDEKK